MNLIKCEHDPRETLGPIGMYHCPECRVFIMPIGENYELWRRYTIRANNIYSNRIFSISDR